MLQLFTHTPTPGRSHAEQGIMGDFSLRVVHEKKRRGEREILPHFRFCLRLRAILFPGSFFIRQLFKYMNKWLNT